MMVERRGEALRGEGGSDRCKSMTQQLYMWTPFLCLRTPYYCIVLCIDITYNGSQASEASQSTDRIVGYNAHLQFAGFLKSNYRR